MYRFDWGTVSPLTESTTNTIKKTKQKNPQSHHGSAILSEGVGFYKSFLGS